MRTSSEDSEGRAIFLVDVDFCNANSFLGYSKSGRIGDGSRLCVESKSGGPLRGSRVKGLESFLRDWLRIPDHADRRLEKGLVEATKLKKGLEAMIQAQMILVLTSMVVQIAG